jgi:hypothetical protein
MQELIDKAKVLKYLTPRIKTETPYGEGYNKALEDSAALVALMPTIEAEPVRHGRWIVHTTWNGMFGLIHSECSECKFDRNGDLSSWKFCPNCGADMRDATDTNVGGKGGAEE